jgi:ADP-ribosylglycohydrolase
MNGSRLDRLSGCLLGTAVGDALGLPREGLSAERAARLFGAAPRHAFLFRRGMLSDDTEHTVLAAQALLSSRGDPRRFARRLAGKLRWWLLGLPAGVGLATARSIVKLWCGWPPTSSGVLSAGDGAAMRAPVLGACLGPEPGRLREWVRASTVLTHRDPRAERAAFLVAFAAAVAASREPSERAAAGFLPEALAALGDADEELRGIADLAADALARGRSVRQFASDLGCPRAVSGYAYHAVPVALYGWLRHPGDFRAAVGEVICCGGDADTTGAIAGGIAGAAVGAAGIPAEWIDGLLEWPRTIGWLRSLAGRLARRFPGDGSAGDDVGEQPLLWPALLPRNLLFLAVVLAHGFRRLFPPWGAGRGG